MSDRGLEELMKEVDELSARLEAETNVDKAILLCHELSTLVISIQKKIDNYETKINKIEMS